ncbi:MAG TPA: DNA polymerase III subunit gamma/tau [Noviherbaspirillum sp.]|uniref:DNA polymerase III subunit gamma/tau n=1 Tax=Noviherbaspirillum sp. TaxID=1926288 RepID=UPI002B4A1C77|nr:DNA polymerase III subunit gamma/tau [Noviherbaspirillum sp.]HJV85866.1 DNA polymerase III subunit gamma/tau [Noviherbaspirillum sp.]
MSYQVLARKYRPRSFETLVGQEHVVRALTHALEQKRLHHAYLFTGTRGVGKTTLSRILAKSLNCESGITATPCGTCEACAAIDAGRFVDYIEMDAASNRGVDEMAQLLEQAVYAPSNARFKVYMIDEVHMLTNHAFNAMLKTLEEPPEHVKFILATTDPQKIPVTVLSRCLQFNLKQMPPGHIVGHLDNILGQEGIEFEPPALRLLAQGAHGSMRDALSLTDQAIAYAAGKVTLESVQGMLGALDQSYLIRVLDALAAKDGAGLLAVADEMATRSLSYSAALQDLGTLLHRIALAQTVPAALPDDVPEREDILRLAQSFDVEDVQLFYQIAVHGRNELSLAPDEYAGFSMTLLRMLAFRPGLGGAEARPAMPAPAVTASAPTARAAAAAPQAVPARAAAPAPAARPSGGMSPARAALEAARNAGKPQAAAPTPARPAPASIPPWENEPPPAIERDAYDSAEAGAQKKTERQSSRIDGSESTLVVEEAPPAAQVEAVKPTERPRPMALLPVPSLNWDGNWPALAASLPLRGVAQQLAQQSELMKCEDAGAGVQMHLRIPIETLCSAGSVDKLAAALSEHFTKPVRVTTEIGAVEQTANAHATAEREARLRQAEECLQSDPFVQTLMREFGATIVPGSVKPI